MDDLLKELEAVVLLPCPFCGTDDHETSPWPSGTEWVCNCGNPDCAVEVTAETPQEAVAKWNTRTHHAEIAEALEDARRYRWLRDHAGSIRSDFWHWRDYGDASLEALIDAAIDAHLAQPAQAVDVGSIRGVIEQMRKASAHRAMPPHYEAGCYMAWIDDLTRATNAKA